MSGPWDVVANAYNGGVFNNPWGGFNPLPPSYTNSGVATTPSFSASSASIGGGGMGWVLPAASVATNALGSLFGGASAAKQAKLDRQQREAEFVRMLGLQQQQLAQQGELGRRGLTDNEAGQAVDIRRQLDAAPLRDKVLYDLTQRMGMTPQAFSGRDMFNPTNGTPQQGGIDLAALQKALSLYKPGMGGVETSVPEAALANLGYRGNYGNNQMNPGAALNQRNYGYIPPNQAPITANFGGYGPVGQAGRGPVNAPNSLYSQRPSAYPEDPYRR